MLFLALTILGIELPDQTLIRRVPKVIHRIKKPVDVNSPNPPQLQLGPMVRLTYLKIKEGANHYYNRLF